MSYGAVLQNFIIALVPFLLTAITLASRVVVRRDPSAGRRGRRTG